MNPTLDYCPRDVELLEEFATATEDYFDMVKKLQHAQGDNEVFIAFESAEMARKNCITAREALHRHREKHGCRSFRVHKVSK